MLSTELKIEEMELDYSNRDNNKFYLYNKYGKQYLVGQVFFILSGNYYNIQCEIPNTYPDVTPHIYITYPTTLYKFNSQETINALNGSEIYKTWRNGPEGVVQICNHYWNSNKRLIDIKKLVNLWLNGYEEHLKTGNTIKSYLDNLRRRMKNDRARLDIPDFIKLRFSGE